MKNTEAQSHLWFRYISIVTLVFRPSRWLFYIETECKHQLCSWKNIFVFVKVYETSFHPPNSLVIQTLILNPQCRPKWNVETIFINLQKIGDKSLMHKQVRVFRRYFHVEPWWKKPDLWTFSQRLVYKTTVNNNFIDASNYSLYINICYIM